MLSYLLEALVLPPASALAMIVVGWLWARTRRRAGKVMTAAGVLWLWASATPCVGGLLLCSLQTQQALPFRGELPPARAIVVLAAGADRDAREYGSPSLGSMTLARLRYAAALHRRTGLPLLCSGGRPASNTPSLAELMRRTAETELGVTSVWTERRSANTFENLAYSAELLRARDIRKVLLVTSAWHMPRSMAAARRAGLEPIAAPTGFRGPPIASWRSFVPHWTGLRDTCLAMHEWGGRLVYAMTP